MDTVFSAFGFQILALAAFLFVTFAPVLNTHGRWHDIATYISYLYALGVIFAWIMVLTMFSEFHDTVNITQLIWLSVSAAFALVHCFVSPPLIEWLVLRK